MPVTAVSTFERFFRAAASLDVDKDDLKRYQDFIHQKIGDLLIRGEANAKANIRDIIEPWDLPITKGLQERVHEFRKLDGDIELEPVLDRVATWPPMELELSEETRTLLPEIAGGLSVALARLFTVLDTKLRNPATEHWERAFQAFDLLL
jgi:hypothetical protein